METRSRAVFSDGNTDTPAVNSVPSARMNRDASRIRINSPASGIASLDPIDCPYGGMIPLRDASKRNAIASIATLRNQQQRQPVLLKLHQASPGYAGNGRFASVKIGARLGNRKATIMPMDTTDMPSRIIG